MRLLASLAERERRSAARAFADMEAYEQSTARLQGASGSRRRSDDPTPQLREGNLMCSSRVVLVGPVLTTLSLRSADVEQLEKLMH